MPSDPAAHGAGVSSASPDQLRRLVRATEEHDAELRRLAVDLEDALEACARSSPDPLGKPHAAPPAAVELGPRLRAVSLRSEHLAAWVARVAAGFARADLDAGAGPVATVGDLALLGPGLGRAGTAEARAAGEGDARRLRWLLDRHGPQVARAWPADWRRLAADVPRLAAHLRRMAAAATDPVYAAAVLDDLGEAGVRRVLVLLEQLGAVQVRARWDSSRLDVDLVAVDLADAVLRPVATLVAAGHRSAVPRALLATDGDDQRRQLALLTAFGAHPPAWAAAAAHRLLIETRVDGRFAVAPSANALSERPELRSVELAALRLLARSPEAAFRFVTDVDRGREHVRTLLRADSPEPVPSGLLDAAAANALVAGFATWPQGRATDARRADLAFQHVVAEAADGSLSGRMRRAVAGLLGTGRKLHLLTAEAADGGGSESRWTALHLDDPHRFVAELVRDDRAARTVTGLATAYAHEQAGVAIDQLRRAGDAGSAATIFVAEGDRVGTLYGLLGLALADLDEGEEHRYRVVRGSLKAVAKEVLDGAVARAAFSGPWGVAAGIGVEAAVALGGAAMDEASAPGSATDGLLAAAEEDLADTIRVLVDRDPALVELVAAAGVEVDDVANAFARAATTAPHLIDALIRS